MSTALAATWHPRGELLRLQRLLPILRRAYSHLSIVLPPDTDGEMAAKLGKLQEIRLEIVPDWSWGRYAALKLGCESGAGHVQYGDLDRLLRWVERLPQEWESALQAVERSDCLVIGRTPAAYASHPQALIRTENISNRVISQLLGRTMDVSAGSKSFSRPIAEYILTHSKAGHALGTDAEWPLLAKRAGARVDYLEVDGLDWESADRYQEQAADRESQRMAARDYDRDPQNWARRVEIALEIVDIGLKTIE